MGSGSGRLGIFCDWSCVQLVWSLVWLSAPALARATSRRRRGQSAAATQRRDAPGPRLGSGMVGDGSARPRASTRRVLVAQVRGGGGFNRKASHGGGRPAALRDGTAALTRPEKQMACERAASSRAGTRLGARVRARGRPRSRHDLGVRAVTGVPGRGSLGCVGSRRRFANKAQRLGDGVLQKYGHSSKAGSQNLASRRLRRRHGRGR